MLPSALCCAPLRVRVRKCECLRRGPCLDRAHSQARGVLFGQIIDPPQSSILPPPPVTQHCPSGALLTAHPLNTLLLVLGRTFLCECLHPEGHVGSSEKIRSRSSCSRCPLLRPIASSCPKMRVSETRPCLDRAHSQARGVLFGQIRLISHFMLVFL